MFQILQEYLRFVISMLELILVICFFYADTQPHLIDSFVLRFLVLVLIIPVLVVM